MIIFKKIALIFLIPSILISLVACTDDVSSNTSQNTQVTADKNNLIEFEDKLLEFENRITEMKTIIAEKDNQIQELKDRVAAVEKKENDVKGMDNDNISYEQLVIESIKVEFKDNNMMIIFEVPNAKPNSNKGPEYNYFFEVYSENVDSKLAQIYIPRCQEEILQNGNEKFVLTMPTLPFDEVRVVMYELTTSRIARFGCDLIGPDI